MRQPYGVIAYYASDVLPPRIPNGVAHQFWFSSRDIRQIEIDNLEDRKDIGSILIIDME